MVYVSEKLRHSGDEAPRGVSFLPSDKNNLFLQPHKKYAVFFLLLCTALSFKNKIATKAPLPDSV